MEILVFILLADGGADLSCYWGLLILFVIIITIHIVHSYQRAQIAKEDKIKAEEDARKRRQEEAKQAEKRRLEAEEKRKAIQKQIDQMDRARGEYLGSLDSLKQDPNNPDLKQNTLALGRKYSELTRKFDNQDGTITVFDEISLMNDINAACAGASPEVKANLVLNQPIEDRLARLLDLKNKHLISEKEYDSRRQKILDEI